MYHVDLFLQYATSKDGTMAKAILHIGVVKIRPQGLVN